MTDSEVLAAEYRAFVKALHPAAVESLVVVNGFWSHRVYPFIPREHEEPLSESEVLECHQDFWRTAEPPLMTLASGHPDPDVRDAAETVLGRLQGAMSYLKSHQGNLPGSSSATVAIERMQDSLQALRRALYHAPFRIERPEPRFNGELVREVALRSDGVAGDPN